MTQLLIVDDELHMIEALEQTIPWEKAGVKHIYTASYGDLALELMQSYVIDILITDIRMPGMSGLELIRVVKNRWPRTQCVLLTGYADFEYAKEALNLNAAEYLLKPVDEDQLLKTVSSIVAKQEEQWKWISSMETSQTLMRDHLPLMKHNLLNSLLLGAKYSKSDLRAKCSTYGMMLNLDNSDIFSLLLIRLGEGFYRYAYHDQTLLEYAFLNIAEELFKPDYTLWYCKDANDYYVFLLFPKSDDTENLTLERLANELQYYIDLYLKAHIAIGISKVGEFPEHLEEMYQSCIQLYQSKVNRDEQWLMKAHEFAVVPEQQSIHTLYEPPTLIHLLEASQWDQARDKIQSICTELRTKSTLTQAHLVEAYYYICSTYLYILHKSNLDADEASKLAEKLQKTPKTFVLDEIERWALTILQQLEVGNLNRNDSQTRTGNHLTKKVQLYIQTHLSGDISIMTLANHVYLNPSYLSRVFKHETGESISSYTMRVRMERAAYDLLNTRKKVYEITSELGYQNPQHFIKVFKKYYELTPQEYRESASRMS
ncbi:hypothetical protein SY83_13535 [Paenibacillus swuensis]|uniref:AraC family transcriptional regulator n=1 Tax=Paenibacillus swuensis TaxID=1178515 RepID=A0A172TK08_9BACL|nr:response regulator [Paenibacillus swuensis]ANE47113.1 hypothetical protein SY83_13535 [Paenibacillus swuensis]